MKPPPRDTPLAAVEAAAPPGARPPKVFKIWDFVVVFVGGQIGGLLLATVGYAVSGDEVDQAGALTLAFGFAGQFLAYGILIWWCCRRRATGSPRRDLGLCVRARDWWALPLGTVSAIVLGLLVLPLRELVDQNQGVVDDLLDSSGAKLAVIAIAAGLLAPIFEELVFRGLLLRALLPRMGPNWAIAVSALTFGAVHFLGGNPLGTLAVFPALVGIGAISGVLAVRSGELSQSILLHMGFNLLAVAGALLS
jgi:membrane protease YdiL (CAAX protease family)